MIRKLLFVLFLSTSLYAQQNIIKTVDSVDIKLYSGLWYEISKIPNRFQDQCEKNATAEYQIDEDGDIIVINKCIDYENEIDVADGIAKVVDKQSNAKLEVSFVSILGWNIFWGDYWILGLEKDYRYAVIGTPSRKYGWILSRSPQMDKKDLDDCYKILEDNGYNLDKFELSVQDI